jgi:hypothetical protein
MLAMLLPLYLLGQPAAGKTDQGGQLTAMRQQFNIAESDLGEISPASETMKLASLGLRGVAATLLWNKAHKYKVLHEWDRLKATLNNIALLQPHFDKVWEHQAHNLAYNVSTEFDDYRQRYEMVREGTEFLTRGVRQNRKAPRLVWYTGWFYGQKMGMSDEKVQFRRLFADDDVIHKSLLEENINVDSPEARGPLGKPDNWLVGRLWLNHGYEVVDSGVKIRRQTPLNFYETGPKWRFKHAEAIESEGILDERAQNAWQMASEDWRRFGARSIPTTSPFTIKLGEIAELRRKRDEAMDQLRDLTGDVYTQARQKKIDALSDDAKSYWQKPESELDSRQKSLMPSILKAIIPDLDQVARASDPSVRLNAVNLVAQIKDLEERINKSRGYRTQINYEYWESLALAEQEERTVKARRLIYEAEQANENAELDKAIELYEEAFVIWADIFDDYPILTIDDTAQDLFESIRRYMVAIDSQELDQNFPLHTFVMMMGDYGTVDPGLYAEIQENAKKSVEKRQQELREEERLREQKVAAEEKANKAKAEAETEDDEAGTEERAASEDTTAEESVEEEMEEQPAESDSDENGSEGEKDASETDSEPSTTEQDADESADSRETDSEETSEADVKND